jgi:AcrR family transcriptional regulator
MTRPSRNTDQLMIETAIRLLRDRGISGLRVREVAAKAGVNLGMFHYYFKTKDEFVKRVLADLYEGFFERFQIESSGSGSPIERLRRALLTLGRFARDNRDIVIPILLDVVRGHKKAVEFTQKGMTRHVFVLLKLIEECQAKALIARVPLPMAGVYLAGSVVFPAVVFSSLQRAGAKRPFGKSMRDLESVLLSDAAIEMRVDLALKGLATGRGV